MKERMHISTIEDGGDGGIITTIRFMPLIKRLLDKKTPSLPHQQPDADQSKNRWHYAKRSDTSQFIVEIICGQ